MVPRYFYIDKIWQKNYLDPKFKFTLANKGALSVYHSIFDYVLHEQSIAQLATMIAACLSLSAIRYRSLYLDIAGNIALLISE